MGARIILNSVEIDCVENLIVVDTSNSDKEHLDVLVNKIKL